MGDDTRGARERLLEAARLVVVEQGYAAASARTVATRAGVAPGVIYYHFDDLETLFGETAQAVSQERAEVWAAELAPCTSLTQIVAVARRLHAHEREHGSLVLLGQLLTAVAGHPGLRDALRANFDLLSGVVEEALTRVVRDTPLDGALDPHALARTVSAAFLGVELFDTTLLDDGEDVFDQLAVLAALADGVLDLGVVTGAWVRRRVQRAMDA